MSRRRLGSIFFCFFALLFILATSPSLNAQPGRSVVPAEDPACASLAGNAFGLCVAYCGAQNCDEGENPSCSVLRDRFEAVTGSQVLPCDLIPPFIVNADVDRPSGVAGTIFELSANAVRSASAVTEWTWRLSDGRQFSGQQVSVSFTAAGVYRATLVARNADGRLAEAQVGMIVFDDQAQAPAEFNLPAKIGDVDGDGVVALKDAHLAAKHAGRLETLQDSVRRAADIDADGKVTLQDSQLIAKAVIDGADLPTVLLPARGAPGKVVTLISPHLLDPAGLFEIEVGVSAVTQKPIRTARGYATFFIPFDATNASSMAVTPGTVNINLIKDGQVVETYPFTVEAPPPLPADPRAELEAFFGEIKTLFDENETLLAAQLDQLGVTGDERSALLASATAGKLEAMEAIELYEKLLNTPSGAELARLYYIILNANGLDEIRAQLQAFLADPTAAAPAALQAFTAAAVSPDEVCDTVLPAICALRAAASLLNTVADVTGIACDLLLAATGVAAVIPADGPVVDVALLMTWVAKCSSAEFGIKMAGIITGLIGQVDPDLRLEASNTAPEAGESVTITALLEVFGADDVCKLAQAGGNASGKIAEIVAERAVNELLRRDFMARSIAKIFSELGGDFLNQFLLKLTSVAQFVIQKSFLDSALQNFAEGACDNLGGGSLVLPSLRVLTGPEPNIGTLMHEADGTATYQCPANPDPNDPTKVTFTAEKLLCDTTQTKTVDIDCQLKEVTITMGDNGFLNDDIYEVRIEGKTVLTSNAPVRAISTTVKLPVGTTRVQMIGHAAPDGVGTYYIRFSGATVVGGDPTSGTDLTPGTVKNFIIQVQ